MRFDEYRKHDAVALAALVAKGEVTAGELLEIAIARAEQVNSAINAIVRTQYPRARAAIAAGLPDGPLRGVPYLIKDLSIFEKGVPAGLGSALYVNFVPDHDSAYTARCKRAGLVIMGRSLTPELGLSPSTEPRQYGPCRNPWNLSYSAGGSSGGSAAAVSAGILPIAHATDGGGSIRTPAAHCALFGLKPSRGRVSYAPDAGEGWGGLAVTHAVSRSVRDSALLLDLTSGPEPGDPYAAPTPERPFADEVGRPPGRLKIAMMRHDHRGAALHPECVKAVENAAGCARASAISSRRPLPISILPTCVRRTRSCSRQMSRARSHADGGCSNASRVPTTSRRSRGRFSIAAARLPDSNTSTPLPRRTRPGASSRLFFRPMT